MATVSHKVCTVCGLDKAATEYYTTPACKNGIIARCKACVGSEQAAWRAANPEVVKARKRAWYLKARERPEYQARIKARADANKAQKREYDRAYRARNPEQQAEWSRDWVIRNPDKRKAISRNYKSKRRTLEREGVSTVALTDWTAAAVKVCYWCGARCPKGFHVDHYVPLAKGGKHELANLVIACAPCNLKKNAKDPFDFAREVGRLF